MILSVTTNIVAALAITTIRMVPCECPDKIPGCCALHTREVKETHYEPIKVDDHYKGDPHTTKGIAFSFDHMCSGLFWAYRNRSDIPELIPVKIYFDNQHDISNHTIGFIVKESLLHEIDKKSEVKK